MARGLGGLIGVGREQKRQALAGLTKSAQLETQTDTLNRQLDAQKRAAQMNVVGTVGGIAAASIVPNMVKKAAAKKAAEAAAAKAAAGGAAGAAGVAGAGVGAGVAGAGAAGASAAAGSAGAATAGSAAAGSAASGGAIAAMGAAAPYVLLAIAGGYLLKKIFD